jgi:hypothetical protein
VAFDGMILPRRKKKKLNLERCKTQNDPTAEAHPLLGCCMMLVSSSF